MWNRFPNPTAVVDSNDTYHGTGNHYDTGYLQGSCAYSGGQYATSCAATCKDTAAGVVSHESGLLTIPFTVHELAEAKVNGSANSGGAQIQCGAQYALGVTSCFGSCTVTASINGTTNGVGGTLNFNPTPFWHSAQWNETTICDARKGRGCSALGMPAPMADGYWQWSGSPLCEWIWRRLGNTPIIIDTDGSGYHLTSAKPSGSSEGGVIFNFWDGESLGILMSWTAHGSTNGFLVLPTTDGKVTSGREMFGNISPQPGTVKDGDENGFAALSLYDSNHDGKIDEKDGVWYALRIWIDANHDGVADPKELHRLSEFGITSFSLKYEETGQKDQYDNLFRWKGEMETSTGPRTIYDVILQATRK